MNHTTKHKSIFRWAIQGFGIALILLAISSVRFLPSTVSASASQNVTGYAWSSTTGWISMNCVNDGTCNTVDYGVNVNTTSGAFSGYGWSYNLGWVKFSSNSCSGTGGGSGAFLNLQTGAVTGWAEIMSPGQNSSNAGGWTGCISMSGTAQNGQGYGVTVPVPAGGNAVGYAWNGNDVGSDSVGNDSILDVGSPLDNVADIGAGWINFSGVQINLSQIPSAFVNLVDDPDFSGSLCGDTATLVWNYANIITNAANGQDCDLLVNGVHDQYIDIDQQSSVSYPINSLTQFRLNCQDAQSTSNSAIIWDAVTLSCSNITNEAQCSNFSTGGTPIDDDGAGGANQNDASCHTDCVATNTFSYDPSIDDETRTCAGDVIGGITGGGAIQIKDK